MKVVDLACPILAVWSDFPSMKNIHIAKTVVTVGLIWWKDMKRHPVRSAVGRVIYRQHTRRGS